MIDFPPSDHAPSSPSPSPTLPLNILPTDRRFRGDECVADRCSRCGILIDDDTVPIMVLSSANDPDDWHYRFHPECLGFQ